MPPNSQTGPTAEQALASLLSSEQLTELVILISSITEGMAKRIADAFDATTDSNAIHHRERLQGEARNPNIGDQTDSGHEETDAEARARILQESRERDLPEPKLQDLKNDAVVYFQTWKDSLILTIVDALNAKDMQGIQTAEVTGSRHDTPPPDYNVLGPHTNPIHSDASLSDLYPATTTILASLPREKRITLLSTLLLILLSQGHYLSYSRILLLRLTSSLRLPLHLLHEQEIILAKGLLEASTRMSADAEAAKRNAESASSRRWKIGLAGVAGAALIGVTGGLAAPLVAGAIGTVMGGLGLGSTVAAGLLGTLAGSGVVVGSLFGAYGYGMTSKMMEAYAKEVEDFAFLPMRRWKRRGAGGREEMRDTPPAEERRLRVTIGVSGWLGEEKDVVKPWRTFGTQSEVYALRWELEALMEMGKSLESMVGSVAWTVAAREVLVRTAFASLMVAMWPLALSGIVDHPFSVAKSRADKAGLVLADAIINKTQGERPVTLIGYSMGARLIYSCLMSLAERRAFGLVESAVLIGTPAPSDAGVWRAMRSVVAGRLVNVYSEKDFVLAYLYRTSSIQFGVAGLEDVDDVKGVENVDITEIASGHLRYPRVIGTILENIGWEDINTQEVERERLVIKMLDEEEERRIAEQTAANGSLRAQEMTTEDGTPFLDVASGNEPENGETGSTLPNRRATRPLRTSNRAAENPLSSTGNTFDHALEAELAKYVEEVAENKYRCNVLDCQKLFKEEHFWRRHVENRHPEWLEGVKQAVLLSAYQRQGPPPAYSAKVQMQPAGSAAKPHEDDLLISFDEPEQKMLVTEKMAMPEQPRQMSLLDMMDMAEEQHRAPQEENPILPERPRQGLVMDMPDGHPRTEVSKDATPAMPERPSQQNIFVMPELHPQGTKDVTPKDDRPAMPEHPRQQNLKQMHQVVRQPSTGTHQERYQHNIYDDDDSEDESGDIVMVDNEDEMTMVEPEPWTGD